MVCDAVHDVRGCRGDGMLDSMNDFEYGLFYNIKITT